MGGSFQGGGDAKFCLDEKNLFRTGGMIKVEKC